VGIKEGRERSIKGKKGKGVEEGKVNATVINWTGEESVRDKITRRRHAVFGHVRRLPEDPPAHMALQLAVNARTGHRPDNRPQWKRPRGRPRHPWMQQLEVDTGLAADAAWDMASDRAVYGGHNDPSPVKWSSE